MNLRSSVPKTDALAPRLHPDLLRYSSLNFPSMSRLIAGGTVLQDFYISKKISGVSVCVSSLKTQSSPFWGDFLSLLTLAEWVAKCNLQIIQIRPVFDTGNHNNPFALISAYALNPIYIRIEELLQQEGFQTENIAAYSTLKKTLESTEHSYLNIRTHKLNFLEAFFHENITESRELTSWIQKNPWIIPYCVFCVLKNDYHHSPWEEWHHLACPSEKIIADFWQKRKKECLFHAWLQYHLERQFLYVVQILTQTGIILKGEIPVELAKDSADVWANRHLFNLHTHKKIHNFIRTPYHWQHHHQQNFTWWKMRLANIEKYFALVQLDTIPPLNSQPTHPLHRLFKRSSEYKYTDKLHDEIHPIFNLIIKHTNLGICLGLSSENFRLSDTLARRLNILPLKSPLYTASQNRFIQKPEKPAHYPLLSVATLSASGSATLHQWWQETHDKSKFLKALGLPEELSSENYSAEIALAVLHAFLTESNSYLVILQIQDYLSLCEQYREENFYPSNKKQISESSSISSYQPPQIKPALEELLTDRRFIFLVKVVNTPF